MAGVVAYHIMTHLTENLSLLTVVTEVGPSPILFNNSRQYNAMLTFCCQVDNILHFLPLHSTSLPSTENGRKYFVCLSKY